MNQPPCPFVKRKGKGNKAGTRNMLIGRLLGIQGSLLVLTWNSEFTSLLDPYEVQLLEELKRELYLLTQSLRQRYYRKTP